MRAGVNVFDECANSRSGGSGRSRRGDEVYASITRVNGRRSVPCSTTFSIPNNNTRFCAERLWDVVTKVKLGIEDEEAGWERGIACADEAGEKICRFRVDGERLHLKYHLGYTIEDREGEVNDSNS